MTFSCKCGSFCEPFTTGAVDDFPTLILKLVVLLDSRSVLHKNVFNQIVCAVSPKICIPWKNYTFMYCPSWQKMCPLCSKLLL